MKQRPSINSCWVHLITSSATIFLLLSSRVKRSAPFTAEKKSQNQLVLRQQFSHRIFFEVRASHRIVFVQRSRAAWTCDRSAMPYESMHGTWQWWFDDCLVALSADEAEMGDIVPNFFYQTLASVLRARMALARSTKWSLASNMELLTFSEIAIRTVDLQMQWNCVRESALVHPPAANCRTLQPSTMILFSWVESFNPGTR